LGNCRQLLDHLCDYLDETGTARQTAEVEQHLARCRKCRILCETTRQTVSLYRRMWIAYELPADVEERLMTALERQIGRISI